MVGFSTDASQNGVSTVFTTFPFIREPKFSENDKNIRFFINFSFYPGQVMKKDHYMTQLSSFANTAL
jgi:hypothetical protein